VPDHILPVIMCTFPLSCEATQLPTRHLVRTCQNVWEVGSWKSCTSSSVGAWQLPVSSAAVIQDAMAPPKASRKGKKAWRKNIDTDAVRRVQSGLSTVGMLTALQRRVRVQTERALEERAREERQSTAVDVLTDSELFFVDKVRLREGTPCDSAQAALGTVRTVFPESLGWLCRAATTDR